MHLVYKETDFTFLEIFMRKLL